MLAITPSRSWAPATTLFCTSITSSAVFGRSVRVVMTLLIIGCRVLPNTLGPATDNRCWSAVAGVIVEHRSCHNQAVRAAGGHGLPVVGKGHDGDRECPGSTAGPVDGVDT